MLKNVPIRHFKFFRWSIRGKSDVVFFTSSLPLPFALACAASVKRMAKASSALMTAPPSSPTWFSWWSSTSSTEECCLANSNTRAPSWPYDTFGSRDPAPQHLTWLCLKWKESPRWSFLFVFIFVRSWWIDWHCCCYTCFYIVVSSLETADFFFWIFFWGGISFHLHGGSRSLMHNFTPEARSFKRRWKKWTLPFVSMLLQILPHYSYQ